MFKLAIRSANPYDDEKLLFTKKEFIFEPGINVLSGCNGSGKSTLIRYLKEYLDENNGNYIYFDRVEEAKSLKERCLKYGEISLIRESLCSSEGEYNKLAFAVIANKIRRYVSDPSRKDKFIIIDAFDSGLSIDMVCEIMRFIEQNPIEDAKEAFKKAECENANLYVIIAANSFEAVRNQRCIDVRTAAIKRFTTYEEYRKYIFTTRRRKNKRLGFDENDGIEEN